MGNGQVLPSHSRLNWAERAGAPLAEGLTCRLRPAGPGRRESGAAGGKGGGEAVAAAELSPSGAPRARWRRAVREGARAGGAGPRRCRPPHPPREGSRRHLPPDGPLLLGGSGMGSPSVGILDSSVSEETRRIIQSGCQRSSTTKLHRVPLPTPPGSVTPPPPWVSIPMPDHMDNENIVF